MRRSKATIESTGDIVYYNANIICNKSDPESPDPPAVFEDTRDSNIIDDCSLYRLSVVRFTMESCTLPLWIPNIQIGQPNINLTTYSVMLSGNFNFNGSSTYLSSAQYFLNYIPRNNAVNPISPLYYQDMGTNYYFVYCYDTFCDMFNQAMSLAYADLSAKVSAWNELGLKSVCPYIMYDHTANLFSIYCDSYGFGNDRTSKGDAQDENLTLSFNSEMYTLLRNFSFLKTSIVGQSYQLIVKNKLGKNLYSYNGVDYYVCTQSYPSTGSVWSPVRSIVFSSYSLPVSPEMQGIDSVIGSTVPIGSGGQSKDEQNMITDIVIDLNSASDYNTNIVYTPSGEYRMIELLKERYLRSMKIYIFWQHKITGQRFPLLLCNNSTISFKIMFRKISSLK